MSFIVLVEKQTMKIFFLSLCILVPILATALESEQAWQSLAQRLSDESLRKNSIAQLQKRESLSEEIKRGVQSPLDMRLALLVIQSLELKNFDADLFKLYESSRDEKVLDTLLFVNKSTLTPTLKNFLMQKWDSLRDQELIVVLNGVDPEKFALSDEQQLKLATHSNSDVVQSFLRYMLKFSANGNFPLEIWKQLLNHPAKQIKFELIADIHSLKNVPEELKSHIKKTCEEASDFEMTEACRLWGFK